MRIFVILLFVASLVSLTGCGKGSNTNSTSAPAATNAPPMEPATNGPTK